MVMFGTIELHGGKIVISVPKENSEPQIIPIVSKQFIPGDKVGLSKSGDVALIERKEQSAIAVVKSIDKQIATLYIANLGPSCPFAPELTFNEIALKIGDRLVVWLHSNGTISSKGIYSNDPLDDVPCLLKMYNLYKKQSSNNSTKQTHLYTDENIICHDNLNTFTIDPASSVDFDDALSVDIENRTIYIHIVDIAHEESEKHITDTRLSDLCLSLYLSNEHTEHLLDVKTASDTLSLVKDEQRRVITVMVILNEYGMVDHYDIYRSTIIVKNRWSYEQVAHMLKMQDCPKELRYLVNLTNKRSEDVKYHINLPSVRFHVNTDSGNIDDLHIESTNDDAHSLIATAMVLANLVVSKHLEYCNVKLPNRFHDSLRGLSNPSFKSTNNELVDSFILVKRYARACYSVDKKGHFGLGLTDYVHFTSPMRRYADVLVHRILAGYQYDQNTMESEVDWLNHRSQVVRSIQDLYINWKIVRHIQNMITNNSAQTFDVWITDVKKGGVLWFMPSFSLNGFAHVSTLKPTQFWYFDQLKNTLQGSEPNKLTISIGKQYKATITSIDPITYVLNLTINI